MRYAATGSSGKHLVSSSFNNRSIAQMAAQSKPLRLELQKKRFMTKYEQNALNNVLIKFNNSHNP